MSKHHWPEGTEQDLKNEATFRSRCKKLRLRLTLFEDGRKVVACRRGGYLWARGKDTYAYAGDIRKKLADLDTPPERIHGKLLNLIKQNPILIHKGPDVYHFKASALDQVATLLCARRKAVRPPVSEERKEAMVATLAAYRSVKQPLPPTK